MGQRNNSKRNASLDDHKERASGRTQNKPEQEAIRTWRDQGKDRTAAGGASGKDGKANRTGGTRPSRGGAKVDGEYQSVGRSTRPARKKSSAH